MADEPETPPVVRQVVPKAARRVPGRRIEPGEARRVEPVEQPKPTE